jgi:hypothetical protein
MNVPRFILYHVWVWRVCWRVVNGRWFILRDAPDWFVADMLVSGVRELEDAAEDECSTRLNNIKREIERLTS